jgi:hypothetical protein
MSLPLQSSVQVLPLFIEKIREGTYFTLPFTLPENVETLTIRYSYERYSPETLRVEGGSFQSQTKVNTIDLGLIAPDGTQVGASGSDKREFSVSAVKATPGYKPNDLQAGRWEIIVGAYKIAPEGVQVTYEIETTFKQRRLLKGDLHMHTVASDGVQTAEELAVRAKRHGLDFIAITDHNQTISAEALPKVDGVSVIPGLEWTHYKAHSNFLGVGQPYDGSFIANNRDEIAAHFNTAHQRGATIVANHPFDEGCPFQLDLASLPIDLIEVWNGPMRESNLKAIGYWHSLLLAGKKVAISGGSDFHRDTPFLFLGGPTTCVYALSNSPADILAALRQGHAFISFAPEGPTLSMQAGDAILGDSLPWQAGLNLELGLNGLLQGDVIRLVTQAETLTVLQAPANGSAELTLPVTGPGFARVEVLRAFLPGLPFLPALISNPIYFD